jgi:hypothetical protein
MSTTTAGLDEVPQDHRDLLGGIRRVVQGLVAPRAAAIARAMSR